MIRPSGIVSSLMIAAAQRRRRCDTARVRAFA
jgi:hypothetical protein